MKFTTVLLLAATGLSLISCEATDADGSPTDAASVLEATRSKLLETPTHQYRFKSFWDNRFASSTYADAMEITYSYLPESELGFGFFAEGTESAILYDGKDKLEIDHIKRQVVRTTATEIGKDSTYFAKLMCFHGDPKTLPSLAEVDRITDTVIAGKSLYAYTTTAAKSGNNTVTTRVYYVDPDQQVVDRISYISHVGRDTSQIIDYFFSGYVFSDQYHTFGAADRGKSLAYREISDADEEQESRSGLIRPGAQLHRADYVDIDGKEQLIYGKAGKKTVVMFGFIGCGNCEQAFREMKKKKFAVRSDVDLVYSSPIDAADKLRPYLGKKEFPFIGFGKESRMNDNFKAAEFPTFVLIDEQGGVEKVLGGYDGEVDNLLFE